MAHVCLLLWRQLFVFPRKTSRKMTKVAADLLSHMRFYCTSHRRPFVWWPDHVERSSPSHRQEYNQNNNSNRKQLLSARFCWVMVFVCLFVLQLEHTTLVQLTCRHRPHLEDWGENISLTKLTNRQTKNTFYKNIWGTVWIQFNTPKWFLLKLVDEFIAGRWMGTTEKCRN